jgi:hypothetical protein
MLPEGQLVKNLNAVSDHIAFHTNGNIQISATGSFSAVGGGTYNAAPNEFSFIGGGLANTNQGTGSVITGGTNNVIQAGSYGSTIGGGLVNQIQSNSIFATIGGGQLNNIGTNSGATTIAGGSLNTIEPGAGSSSIAGGSGNRIQSGAVYSAIGGGDYNTIATDARHSAISGGAGNSIWTNSFESTISGGVFNTIQGSTPGAMIGGGVHNVIQTNAFTSTIAGGGDNSIQTNAHTSTIGGGGNNTIESDAACSTICGGSSNKISSSAPYSTVPGGAHNLAAGAYSFVAGQQARALHQGAFVWADSQNAPFASTTTDQFNIRAGGGVRLNSDTSMFFGTQTRQMLHLWGTDYGIGVQKGTEYFRTSSGFSWFKGGRHSDGENDSGGGAELMRLDGRGNLRTLNGAIATLSDRNSKERFELVNVSEVLDKVAALPISSWTFKTDPNSRHLGPMAQDFRDAFGLGLDDKSICTMDAEGVALAAIQGLNKKLEKQIQEKEAIIEDLKRRLERLEEVVSANPQKGPD